MTGLNFLIVDDSARNRKLLRVELEAVGHAAVEAANGVEALAVLERASPDAVISDILMPAMDGFRLCLEIRRSAKSYCRIPLILYTATYDSPSDRELANTVGADAYILKPCRIDTLIETAREAVKKANLPRSSPPAAEQGYVLQQYNAALVHKLETRNDEVRESLAKLQAAHTQILEFNQLLEARVAQRTAALDTANKELEAFSFSVSHDLQAPLQRIAALAQTLNEAPNARPDAESTAVVAQIIDASAQMRQLIDALLAFARSSRTEMHMVEVDLNELVDKALRLLQAEISRRNIEWRRSALPRAPHGDAVLLQQVFVNLLGNAIKYTRSRSPAIIEVNSRPGRANEIVIFIKDNGVGFDMRYADRLFGVFQRMHRADEFEGTGIGLANVQRIITRHGGTTWAHATPGAGATFYFSLPAS